MNALWSRGLKLVYGKEPITGFVLIAGAVDVAIGSLDQSSSLVFFGLCVVSAALGLRLWQFYRRPTTNRGEMRDERVALSALPPQSSRPSLPTLSVPKKR
ncbi:hypothetical protein GS601_02650 [Myxacorys almedinensis A]|uniref:Uncharacterized protein n=1 Tax=Myxacorys almedinensis A TaxID=2690445 RepID=A0A8J7YWZ7_9CYAN|nr:hypothetical protein [Myxacorys almedinensis A]